MRIWMRAVIKAGDYELGWGSDKKTWHTKIEERRWAYKSFYFAMGRSYYKANHRYSDSHNMLIQGCTNFLNSGSKIKSCRCHNGDMKKVPNWEYTNTERHLTKLSRHSDLAAGIGTQVVHTFCTLHGNWSYCTAFTTDVKRNLSWARWIQNTPLKATSESPSLILSSHLCLDHPNIFS